MFRRYGDAAFFVLDTRRYRSGLSNRNHPSILGNQQFQDLVVWLGEVILPAAARCPLLTCDVEGYIIRPVHSNSLFPLCLSQPYGQTDLWAAFIHERSILLDILHTIPNLFVLTGDRHEFAAIEFNGLFDWSNTIYEFSTSPLSMFYALFIPTLDTESLRLIERTCLTSRISGEGENLETKMEKFSIGLDIYI